MMYDKHKMNDRNSALLNDILHIMVGIVVVFLAVITFLNPLKYIFLFPLVFILAAGLNCFNGIYKMKQSKRNKKKMISAICQLIIFLFLVFMAVISGISIWG